MIGMLCSGICIRCKSPPMPTWLKYKQDHKCCSYCGIFLDARNKRCPYCKTILRIKPRGHCKKHLSILNLILNNFLELIFGFHLISGFDVSMYLESN